MSEKQILLSREHDITDFCSSDASRYSIIGVHYDPVKKIVEATNGHIAIRIPVMEVDGEFPATRVKSEAEPKECIIPVAQYKKALANIPKRSNLAILAAAKLDMNGQVSLTTTDLDTEQTVSCKAIEAQYPPIDQVFPQAAPTLSIALGADALAKIVDYAQRHGNPKGNVSGTPIVFRFISDLEAVTFEIPTKGKRKAVGVLMPIRLQ